MVAKAKVDVDLYQGGIFLSGMEVQTLVKCIYGIVIIMDLDVFDPQVEPVVVLGRINNLFPV